jgi:hypothetical protein
MLGLSNGVKVSALKLNPPSLASVLWERFFKALNCYDICNLMECRVEILLWAILQLP